MLAVGEHLLGSIDDRVFRMTTGLAGGVGSTEQEICGAVSGGVLIIGAIHGRVRPDVDDSRCQRLAALYLTRFGTELGAIRCGDLLALGYGSDGGWPCSALVERAIPLLLDILDHEA